MGQIIIISDIDQLRQYAPVSRKLNWASIAPYQPTVLMNFVFKAIGRAATIEINDGSNEELKQILNIAVSNLILFDAYPHLYLTESNMGIQQQSTKNGGQPSSMSAYYNSLRAYYNRGMLALGELTKELAGGEVESFDKERYVGTGCDWIPDIDTLQKYTPTSDDVMTFRVVSAYFSTHEETVETLFKNQGPAILSAPLGKSLFGRLKRKATRYIATASLQDALMNAVLNVREESTGLSLTIFKETPHLRVIEKQLPLFIAEYRNKAGQALDQLVEAIQKNKETLFPSSVPTNSTEIDQSGGTFMT